MLSKISQSEIPYVESKEQNKQTKQKHTHRHKGQAQWQLPEESGVEEVDEKGEGIKKYKLVGTEQSQRCKLQHRKYSE